MQNHKLRKSTKNEGHTLFAIFSLDYLCMQESFFLPFNLNLFFFLWFWFSICSWWQWTTVALLQSIRVLHQATTLYDIFPSGLISKPHKKKMLFSDFPLLLGLLVLPSLFLAPAFAAKQVFHFLQFIFICSGNFRSSSCFFPC